MDKAKILFISFFTVLFLLVTPSVAHASLFNDIINGVKNLVSPTGQSVKSNQLTVDSSITIAPEGDVNKNGQIDAGDTVSFSFTIDNPTDTFYKLASLNTHIQRDSLNYIHEVKGVTGIDDNNNNIIFPNLRIDSQSHLIISFDARINYFIDQNVLLSTEPEITTSDQKQVLKSSKKEIRANRIKKEDIPNLSKFTIKAK